MAKKYIVKSATKARTVKPSSKKVVAKKAVKPVFGKLPTVVRKGVKKYDDGGKKVSDMFKDPKKRDEKAGIKNMYSKETLTNAGISAGTTVGVGLAGKGISKAYGATAYAKRKAAEKLAAKQALKTGAKTVGKTILKTALKAVPVVGTAVAVADVANEFREGYNRGIERENKRLKEYNTDRYSDGSTDYHVKNKAGNVKTTVSTSKSGDKTVRVFNKTTGKVYTKTKSLGGKYSKVKTKKVY
jgi:hypothetical protein